MSRVAFAATAVVACLAGAAAAQSAGPAAHRIYTPAEIRWGPAPPSLPTGAQAALLYGDPTKDGLFALRLKLPKGYRIAPHTHPKPEILTVVSGTFKIGMGRTADATKATALPAGGFFAFDPGMEHYASVDEETVVQLNSTGPWTINYVNPADDPRTKR